MLISLKKIQNLFFKAIKGSAHLWDVSSKQSMHHICKSVYMFDNHPLWLRYEGHKNTINLLKGVVNKKIDIF